MAKREVLTRVITIDGVVQGVGFRPFVANLAFEMGIDGLVRNEGGRVYIEATGTGPGLEAFQRAIISKSPLGSHIVAIKAETINGLPAKKGFTIEKSAGKPECLRMPSPDLAVCAECVNELYEKDNARYLNPFISCTHCGPRYSIIREMPYDKGATTMAAFPLCETCQSQYDTLTDRRYHAQTICCNHCGPVLSAPPVLGGITAIKGIGGFHLACSPFNREDMQRLRALKGREHKPFAVMFLDLDAIREHCEVSSEEAALLTSLARPIVLLKRKQSPIDEAVYKQSPYLGAFLPYTPLQHLVLKEFGPLVMTSANLSFNPIIISDEEMAAFSGVDRIIGHDREILRRLDDSVVQVVCGKTQFLRRARGYVPLAIPMEGTEPAVALGAQEKNTFCLFHKGFAYLSQENGDVEDREQFGASLIDMATLLEIAPQQVACDKHPGYETTEIARAMKLPITWVQHHYAHIASVMAEHLLEPPLLGVAFDGTGYGEDGSIWGGEFLLIENGGFRRLGHLKAIPYLGGDEAVLESWKSALCLMDAAELPYENKLVQAALKHGINTHLCSSMGRLFDGISALLGICTQGNYSGQPAIELEYAATRAVKKEKAPFTVKMVYEEDRLVGDFSPCIREIHGLYAKGESADELAYRFHVTVAHWIVAMCLSFKIKTVALSGGVFQNRLLLEMVEPGLAGNGFQVFWNHLVPPGDGGISLGQMYLAKRGEKNVFSGAGENT